MEYIVFVLITINIRYWQQFEKRSCFGDKNRNAADWLLDHVEYMYMFQNM